MAVAALSSAGLSQYINAASNLSASQQAWQTLGQSLASGNLTTAQTAFNNYQKINQNLTDASGSGSSTSTTTQSQLSKDLTALGTAIGSGKLSTAQSAYATVQSDLQTTHSQAVTAAEAAVTQSVQWVEDLFTSSNSISTTTTADPFASILDSAFGTGTSTTTNPMVTLLEDKYANSQSGSSTSASTAAGSTAAKTTSYGNQGSGASVNRYA